MTGAGPGGLGYLPYEQLGDRPHVMVDGAARPSTVLTLSHWPQSPTPRPLWRDLSVEIVLAFLEAGRSGAGRGAATGAPATVPAPPESGLDAARAAWSSAEAVTNDHFDEDGLMSLFAAMVPESALGVAELITDVASCGDFGVVASDTAAKIAFAIPGLAEAEAGPGSGTGERYRAVLPRTAELLGHPDRFEAYWWEEFAVFEAGRRALAAGSVVIEERPAVDLAVVRQVSLPSTAQLLLPETGRLPGASGGLPVHAAVVHSATAASRILAFDGDFCECYFRYEGWVRYVSRTVPLRPDLAPLAARLTALEPGPVIWESNPVGAIVGRLRPRGEGRTGLDPVVVERVVVEYLEKAAPAWDPFRPGGGFVPEGERAAYLSGGQREPTDQRSRRGRRRRRRR